MTQLPTWSPDDGPSPDYSSVHSTPAPDARAVSPSWFPAEPSREFDPDVADAIVECAAQDGDDGSIDHDVHLPSSGRYHVWAKCRVDRSSSVPVWTSGVLSLTVDDGRSSRLRTTRAGQVWRPFLAGPLTDEPLELPLDAGVHTLSLTVEDDVSTVEALAIVRSEPQATPASTAARVSDEPFLITER